MNVWPPNSYNESQKQNPTHKIKALEYQSEFMLLSEIFKPIIQLKSTSPFLYVSLSLRSLEEIAPNPVTHFKQ